MSSFFANFSLVISHLLLYNISLLLRKGLSTWSKSNNRMAPLELHIAVDHGVNISALAHSIINEVSYKVNQATGVPVACVDVYVDTMFLD